mmetsp:Transcript_48231/g.148904  ORF Transcript_48231/g.148904 Transcript_48231/m.148904 type:complete len:346 (+) Transcript_48231:550-1587(+)
MGCHRVEWKCNALNERSRNAAQRLGFSFEGISRQHCIVKGRNRDTAWFGMLESDWPTVRLNMERWLYSDAETSEPVSLAALNRPVLRPASSLPGVVDAIPLTAGAGRLLQEPDPHNSGIPVGLPVEAGSMREPSRQAMGGRFAELQPMAPERHAGALFDVSHGWPEAERLWTYLPQDSFASEADLRAFLDTLPARDDAVHFTILGGEDGRPLGMAAYLGANTAMRTVEIGLWVSALAPTSKVVTESAFLLLCHAFEETGCRRVEWRCDALSKASREAAQRLGFSFEGVHLHHRICKDRSLDIAWFGMLESDWPMVRSNMKRWLYSDAETCDLESLNRPMLRPALC